MTDLSRKHAVSRTTEGGRSCILSHDTAFIDCSIFQFGWEKCTSLHSFGPATRNHFLFHYIMSGQGTFISTNSMGHDYTYTLHSGQGFLIFPGQRTHYYTGEHNPWEYMWIEFDGLKAQEALNLAGLTYDSPVYNSNVASLQRVLQDELLYITNHGDAGVYHLMGHMYLFLDALQRSSNQRKTAIGGNLSDMYIREAIHFIEQNYQNEITIEDIALFCNLNRSYFGKLFRKVMNITPQEFLIRYRMTKACEYLELTERSIGEISNLVGYPSQLHFSRAFKKINGISPREWRYKNIKKREY